MHMVSFNTTRSLIIKQLLKHTTFQALSLVFIGHRLGSEDREEKETERPTWLLMTRNPEPSELRRKPRLDGTGRAGLTEDSRVEFWRRTYIIWRISAKRRKWAHVWFVKSGVESGLARMSWGIEGVWHLPQNLPVLGAHHKWGMLFKRVILDFKYMGLSEKTNGYSSS